LNASSRHPDPAWAMQRSYWWRWRTIFGELVRVILPPALVSKRSARGETLQPGRLLASGAEGLRRPSHTQSRYEREPSWPAGTGAQVNRFWSSSWSCGLSACDEFGEGTGLRVLSPCGERSSSIRGGGRGGREGDVDAEASVGLGLMARVA
jgi:hypothetical protein